MRLGALLLSAGLGFPAMAQAARALPWEGLPSPPWQSAFEELAETPAPPPVLPSAGGLRARLSADGALQVVDARGVVHLRTGLPGRPLKVWRDGGVPLPAPWDRMAFPTEASSPLFSADFWNRPDPRPALAGLLWVQDDGERTLSLVHPATGKVAFLLLPEAPGLELRFLAAGLEARERPGEEAAGRGRIRRWLLPWVALVPILARLAPPSEPPKAGTALEPFPRERGW